MNELDAIKEHCAYRLAVTAEYPFGPEALVYKVMGKMFALISEPDGSSITLKCDPALAEGLRAAYAAIEPGYHTNKRHWNTVTLDGSVPLAEILGMIDHSYEQVVRGLTKAQRAALLEVDK